MIAAISFTSSKTINDKKKKKNKGNIVRFFK